MSLPTKGETYSQIMEHLRKAQEGTAMMAHLTADDSPVNSRGWLMISELFKRTQEQVIQLATKVMH